jgi:hypothetical protein
LPSSYCPVAILLALSMVLETVIKEDLEAHLTSLETLITKQFRFRRKKVCAAALSTAHAAWLKSSKTSIVGVLGFDLSAAFDTVCAEQLLPKQERIGI